MRTLFISSALVFTLLLHFPAAGAQTVKEKSISIAVQCWTYHKFTFYETLDQAKELGVKYLQAYPGQKLDKADLSKKFDHSMDEATVRAVKDKLESAGISVVAYGVVGFRNEEADIRRVFDFARKMGIGIVVCEPAFDDWALLAKLAREYDLNIAIHNHPLPSKYARPEAVAERIQTLDKRFGACADNGHWIRAGVNPMDALRLLEGRILDVHLKDLDRAAAEGVDVPFGQGISEIRELLSELNRQNYTGYLTIEYENPDDVDNPSPSVRKCMEFLKMVSK